MEVYEASDKHAAGLLRSESGGAWATRGDARSGSRQTRRARLAAPSALTSHGSVAFTCTRAAVPVALQSRRRRRRALQPAKTNSRQNEHEPLEMKCMQMQMSGLGDVASIPCTPRPRTGHRVMACHATPSIAITLHPLHPITPRRHGTSRALLLHPRLLAKFALENFLPSFLVFFSLSISLLLLTTHMSSLSIAPPPMASLLGAAPIRQSAGPRSSCSYTTSGLSRAIDTPTRQRCAPRLHVAAILLLPLPLLLIPAVIAPRVEPCPYSFPRQEPAGGSRDTHAPRNRLHLPPPKPQCLATDPPAWLRPLIGPPPDSACLALLETALCTQHVCKHGIASPSPPPSPPHLLLLTSPSRTLAKRRPVSRPKLVVQAPQERLYPSSTIPSLPLALHLGPWQAHAASRTPLAPYFPLHDTARSTHD